MIKKYSVFGIGCAALAVIGSDEVLAQSNQFVSHLIQTENKWEQGLQQNLRDFRLMRLVETFPERLNATHTFHVVSEPDVAVATLHEISTGKPLESCLTPCDLHVNPNLPYAVVTYKFGYLPQPSPINPGDTKTKLWFGTNYLEVVRKHKKCWGDFKSKPKIDGEAEVCVRMPPVMPHMAKKSGHCKMVFDLSEKGRPINIKAEDCTEEHFAEPSIGAVKWWYYTPKVERGQAVTQTGVETQMTFKLADEEGNLIPE